MSDPDRLCDPHAVAFGVRAEEGQIVGGHREDAVGPSLGREALLCLEEALCAGGDGGELRSPGQPGADGEAGLVDRDGVWS